MHIDEYDKFGLPLNEMANIGPKLTGLTKTIHIWSQGEERSIGHGPRVKVSFYRDKFVHDESVGISISDDPKIVYPNNFKFSSSFTKNDFNLVRDWIIARKDILLRYWKDPTVTVDDIIG